MILPDPLDVTFSMIEALDKVGVIYFIGGSLASAFYGISRATMDADLVVDLHVEQVQPLIQALGPSFYADAAMMIDAIIEHGSFNVIHLETLFKIDLFVRRNRPYDQVQFSRRRAYPIAVQPERTAYFASPEDVILAKMEWYNLGGQTSDRQWQDILNVLRIQGNRLERDYLQHWAAQLGVLGLLEQALQQADDSLGN